MYFSFKMVVISTLALVLVLSIAPPWGYLATRMACKDTGGMTAAQTFDTNGYFDATSGLDCYYCINDVATGLFQYVDVFYERPLGSQTELTTGFQRFELLSAPDVRCDWGPQRNRPKVAKTRYGLDDDQCIGRYPIDEHEVSRFESRLAMRKPVYGPMGVDLLMNEMEIIDRESGDRIARGRDFLFVNSLTRALGNRSATFECSGVGIALIDPFGFRADVLKDKNGERFEVTAADYVPSPPKNPDEFRVDRMNFSKEAVVHAVGVYRAAPKPNYRPTYSGTPDIGEVIVDLLGTGKVILVLSAHDPVHWIIQSRAVQVEQIVVFGFGEQQVAGIGNSTQVHYNPEVSFTDSRIYAYASDSKFLALNAAVQELTGKQIATFQGDYDVERFSVQVGPKIGVTDVTRIQKWTDEHGVVYYGDSPPTPASKRD